jgi:hypothetical protein
MFRRYQHQHRSRSLTTILVLVVTLSLVACTPIENQARDTIAALGGLLGAAQVQNQAACQADNTQNVCVIINKAVAGQNALVTATEAYCGWSVTSPPGDPTTKCVPVKTALGALQTSISNANTFITELKGVVK